MAILIILAVIGALTIFLSVTSLAVIGSHGFRRDGPFQPAERNNGK
jgi:hypothetical protein